MMKPEKDRKVGIEGWIDERIQLAIAGLAHPFEKRIEQFNKRPKVETSITKSDDGKSVVLKTTITDIKPAVYHAPCFRGYYKGECGHPGQDELIRPHRLARSRDHRRIKGTVSSEGSVFLDTQAPGSGEGIVCSLFPSRRSGQEFDRFFRKVACGTAGPFC